MKDSSDVFVGIRNLSVIRKDLLTASKDILRVLRNHDEYRKLRTEKLQNVVKLYKVMTEIASLNRKMKNMLPKIALEDDGSIVAETDSKVSVVRRPTKSKLDILEDELAVIEERLSALG
ncbi:hypothetical protein HY484_03435 [Candidatus Woesearchaeota archaeon]|nr:hypothetical protein [Candidatus Woesearchaeota archaeon]